MNYRGRLILFKTVIIFCVTFNSCSESSVSKEGLISYLEKNVDLNQIKIVNGIKIQLRYCPYQLLVQQEIEALNTPDSNKVIELRKKYSLQYYFRLSFSKNDKQVIRQMGSFSEYSQLLQTLSFQMDNYINAVTDLRDTLYLKSFVFEQDYGMANSNTLLLVFDKMEFKDSKRVVVNIGEFGLGLGALQFKFEKSELERTPELKYNIF